MQGMLSGGTEDEAVKAVATNNWVADSIASDVEGVTKKSAIELLKRFEANFDRVLLPSVHSACACWQVALCSIPQSMAQFVPSAVDPQFVQASEQNRGA